MLASPRHSRAPAPEQGRAAKTPATAVTKRALLIERLGGPLNNLTPEIRSFGYEVLRAADAHAGANLISSLRRLSLVLINGATLRTDPARFVGAIKEHHPDLPILWLADETKSGQPPPDKLEFVSDDLEKLRARIARIVHEGFYSAEFIRKVMACAQGVVRDFGLPDTASEPCIKSSLSTLSEVTAFILFYGGGLAGHVLLSASVGDLSTVYRQQFRGATSFGHDDLEDFLGEVSNCMVGQIKALVPTGAEDCRIGLPHFIRGINAGFRYKAGTPSLAIDFGGGGNRLQFELCIHRFDGGAGRADESEGSMKAGIVTFL